MEGRSARFARNAGYSIAGQIAVALTQLLTIPYLVGRLGPADYGLFIVMQATAGYLTLLTFGAGNAAVKFIAQHKDTGALRDALSWSLLVHLAGTLVGAAAVAAFAPWVAEALFDVPSMRLELAAFLIRCAAGAAVFAALLQAASTAIIGLQRFDWHNALTAGLAVVFPVGACLLAGRGVAAIGGWNVAATALAAVAGSIVAARLLAPHFKRGAERLGWGAFVGHSLGQWTGLVATAVSFQLDRVFVARATNLVDLTYYSVPAGLLQRLAALPQLIAHVLLPMMAELRGEGAGETLARIYMKAVRFLAAAMFPVFIMIFAYMPQFLTLWVGGDFSDTGVWPARLLVLAHAAGLLAVIPNAMTLSQGRPWYMPMMAWSQAALSLLIWSNAQAWGLEGVAFGAFLGQAVPVAFYLRAVHRNVLQISTWRFARQALLAPGLAAIVFFVAAMTTHAWADSWIKLIVSGLAGLAVYTLVLWPLLDPDDRRIARGLAGV